MYGKMVCVSHDFRFSIMEWKFWPNISYHLLLNDCFHLGIALRPSELWEVSLTKKSWTCYELFCKFLLTKLKCSPNRLTFFVPFKLDVKRYDPSRSVSKPHLGNVQLLLTTQCPRDFWEHGKKMECSSSDQ